MLLHAELSHEIMAAAIEVHRELGPGLLESSYQACLCHELTLRQIPIRYQIELPLRYKGVYLDCGYKLDIIADEKIILEVKSVTELHPVHEAQLLPYLKLANVRVGLLMNFNVPVIKDGVKRLIR